MRLVSAQEFAAIAGIPAQSGAVWMPRACVTNPAATVRALLDHPLIEVRERTCVDGIAQCPVGWRIALEPTSAGALTSPLVILATAGAWTPVHSGSHVAIDRADALASAALPHVPLDGTRGQLSFIKHSAGVPRAIISSHGFALPPLGGSLCLGATHERGNDSLQPTARDDAHNLLQLERIAPALLDPSTAPERTGAWVGLRGTVNDHLPVIGAVTEPGAFAQAFAKLCDGPFAAKWPPAPLLRGLHCTLAHGSRGTSTALLGGELLADIVTGAVRCVTDDMLPTLLPQRFHVRALRRGEASAVT
jgi:tRNA 5-methylaminomethyl-2-thiouridine biosynthesis bifunctional protein